MAWADRQLEPGEEVVFRTGLHPISLAGTASFAAFVLGAAALIVVRNDLAASTVGYLWLGAAAVVALAFVSPALRSRTSEWVVTTRRVLVSTGAARTQHTAVALNRLEAVSVTQTPLGRLLGYGTVQLGARGGPDETFPRVARAQVLREAIRRQAGPSRLAGAR